MANDTNQHLREFCANHFKDFQFGLKLISQNTGQTEFSFDVDSIQAPDKTLSQWVVESYRKKTEAH
jgi:ATP-dependent Clp protease ATP-binding subunit ClpX